jgi:hypothetical protein
MMSGASYILMIPSDEEVARTRPKVFGPNFTSVTLVRESTRFVLRIHLFVDVLVGPGLSLTVSSHTEAVLSKLALAMI